MGITSNNTSYCYKSFNVSLPPRQALRRQPCAGTREIPKSSPARRLPSSRAPPPPPPPPPPRARARASQRGIPAGQPPPEGGSPARGGGGAARAARAARAAATPRPPRALLLLRLAAREGRLWPRPLGPGDGAGLLGYTGVERAPFF